MGTITVNVKDDIEEEFKVVASVTHGGEEGYVEKAVIDAMQSWLEEKRRGKIAERNMKYVNI